MTTSVELKWSTINPLEGSTLHMSIYSLNSNHENFAQHLIIAHNDVKKLIITKSKVPYTGHNDINKLVMIKEKHHAQHIMILKS